MCGEESKPLPGTLPARLRAAAKPPLTEICGAISFWLPEELFEFWNYGLAVCRAANGVTIIEPYGGEQRKDPTLTECVEIFLDSFIAEWDVMGEFAKRDSILARDGYRCQNPVCRNRRHLHKHHPKFRSRGGSDESTNKCTTCESCHQRGVHKKYIRVTGEAPGNLTWDIGTTPGEEPIMTYIRGERAA
jgi:hypothetical protein